MIKRKKFVAVLLILALITMLSSCNSKDTVRLGTAQSGGVYSRIGDKLCELAKESNIQLENKNTAGSGANVRLLNENYLDMAIVQADCLDTEQSTIKAVAGLYTESCQIMVSKTSDINSVDDLAGKRVSVGDDQSGTDSNAKNILSVYGLSEKLVNIVNAESSKSAQMLKNGEIDAMFYTVGKNSDTINELANTDSIKFINIDDEHIKRLTELYDYFTKTVIPAGNYKNQTSDIVTVGVKAVLVANSNLSDEKVQSILNILLNNVGGFTDINENTLKSQSGIPIEFHSGAIKGYNENGINL